MFFLNLPSGARCAGRDGKAAEPVHAGPPVGNHLIAVSEPCRRSARGEIRDPKPDGAPSRPGLQVQGEEGTLGDFYPMGPKSRASWQHGLPAGTATNSEALWSKGVQGEERFRRDCCLQGPKSMASWQHGLPASSDALRE